MTDGIITDALSDDENGSVDQIDPDGGDGTDDRTEGDEEDEEIEMGPAGDFGMKLGVPIGLVTAYLLLFSQHQVFSLSSNANELFAVHSDAATPLFYVAIVTGIVGYAGGVAYPMIAEDLYDDYKQDLALGTVFAPAAVILLSFAVVTAEPVFLEAMAGNFAEAALMLVIMLIILAILVGSSIGVIIALLFFGLYLGLPSYVGVYLGAFLGELGRSSPS